MSARYRFVASAASHAWTIIDSENRHVPGAVFLSLGGGYEYQRGRWNGKRQIFDHLRAESMEALGERIETYLGREVA